MVKTVNITGENGTSALDITRQTPSLLESTPNSLAQFTLGLPYSLILGSDARADSFPITFQFADGSVTPSKLDRTYLEAPAGSSMTLKQDGKVGIGTESPNGKFHTRNFASGTDFLLSSLGTVDIGLGGSTGGWARAFRVVDSSSSNGKDGGAFGVLGSGTTPSYAYISIPTDDRTGYDSTKILVLDNSGRVGIGTKTPTYPLTLQTNSPYSYISIINAPSTNVTSNFGMGLAVWNQDSTPGNYAGIAFKDAPGNWQGSIGVKYGSHATDHDSAFFIEPKLVPTPSTFVILPNGRVGIGTPAPDQLLSVNGDASKVGGGFWLVYSDDRLKTVTGSFQRGLKEILKVNPIYFHYRKDNELKLPSDQPEIGVSAQQIEKVIPEAVTKNSKGYLMLKQDPILWTTVNAIKEHDKELKALQAELSTLKDENKTLKSRLDRLEKFLTTKQ